MKLAPMLRLYRAANGLEQKELAEQIGIPAGAISRIEQGAGMTLQNAFTLFLWLISDGPAVEAEGKLDKTASEVVAETGEPTVPPY